MFKKEFNAKFKWLEIVFKNSWSFNRNTIEELFINWKIIEKRNYKAKFKDLFLSKGNKIEFNVEYDWFDIKIIWGDAWYIMWIWCEIYVDNKFVWWTKLINIKLIILYIIIFFAFWFFGGFFIDYINS